jgi:hypothetical protein
MRIIYLDQNKWIELAIAGKAPERAPGVYRLLEILEREVNAGRLILPLTATNLYETHKINNLERRSDIATVQTVLSRGKVFRGRHKRLEVEFNLALRPHHALPTIGLAPQWFLSDVFFEAVSEWGDPRLPAVISDRAFSVIQNNPIPWLYNYLVELPDDVRIAAVKNYSAGSQTLCAEIEARRARHANESKTMRERIQSALLMINEIDLLMTFAARTGLPWKTVADMGRENALRIINDIPTFHIEREMGVRIEAARSRAIHPNDLRDMQSFCAVIRYADIVVAENMFSNVARQAKLDGKYGTTLFTNILSLTDILGESVGTEARKASA